MTALRAWNSDATRMPARMHSEYLRRLYLHNDLSEGRFRFGGHTVLLEDLTVPLFVVATERDHVSPWTSVYKIHRLAHAPISFVLVLAGITWESSTRPVVLRRTRKQVTAKRLMRQARPLRTRWRGWRLPRHWKGRGGPAGSSGFSSIRRIRSWPRQWRRWRWQACPLMHRALMYTSHSIKGRHASLMG
jgi:hypothetical protein